MKKLTILFALIAVSIYGLKAQIAWPLNGTSIYYNGGNVGIGTTTPSEKLHIRSTFPVINLEKAGILNWKIGNRLENNFSIYSDAGAGDALSINCNTGNVGIGTTTSSEKLHIRSTFPVINLEKAGILNWKIGNRLENNFSIYSDAGAGDALSINCNTGNVGIGTTNPTAKLAVNGNIKAKEVNVTLDGWADFVFHPTYKLRTLGEVEQFIKANSHLPEIPTAAEVKENGVSLGEMNAKLLQKVEELTLYMIEQQKIIEKQNLRIEKLEKTTNSK
ncbi:MAG: hypothetical protein EHM93_13400 [Bacteroidales bacterium]|nr:MAG: hypothetical protein EHM93_13400 [Bacteroidales bacterium]